MTNEKNLPDFDDVFITKPGSIGEYVYDDCPQCKIRYGGEDVHQILVCRNCGAPPVASGCICDAAARQIAPSAIYRQ